MPPLRGLWARGECIALGKAGAGQNEHSEWTVERAPNRAAHIDLFGKTYSIRVTSCCTNQHARRQYSCNRISPNISTPTKGRPKTPKTDTYSISRLEH
jgi:hypothetical protein